MCSSSAFQRAGWSPLVEDLWNPGIPSSNQTGWTNFIDGRNKPEVRVYQWLGYWRNASGSAVMYVLQYVAQESHRGAAPIGTAPGMEHSQQRAVSRLRDGPAASQRPWFQYFRRS